MTFGGVVVAAVVSVGGAVIFGGVVVAVVVSAVSGGGERVADVGKWGKSDHASAWAHLTSSLSLFRRRTRRS